MLEAINLDQHAVALGNPVHPLALIDRAVALKHPATSMPPIVNEVTLILDPCRPANLGLALDYALFDRARIDSLERLFGLSKERDCSTPNFALFRDGDLPVAGAVLAPFHEVAGEDAPIVADQLTVAFGLTISKVPNVSPTVLVRLNSRSMLEAILEKALVDVA